MDAPARLKAFLSERGLSQRAAAAQLECSQAHLSGFMDGRCRPGADIRVRIETLTADAKDGPIRVADWTKAKVTKLGARRRRSTSRRKAA